MDKVFHANAERVLSLPAPVESGRTAAQARE
jgi:hypothetical protein